MRLASSRLGALEAISSAQTQVCDAAGSIKSPLKAAAAATACVGGLLAVAKGYRDAKRVPMFLPGGPLLRMLLVPLAMHLLPKMADYVVSPKTQGVFSALTHPRRTIGNRFYRWLGLER